MTRTSFLVETPHDGTYPVYRLPTLDLALDNACALITLYLTATSPYPIECPVLRERLERLIRAEDYRTAIRMWNEYQNRNGDPQLIIVIHRVLLEECIIS